MNISQLCEEKKSVRLHHLLIYSEALFTFEDKSRHKVSAFTTEIQILVLCRST